MSNTVLILDVIFAMYLLTFISSFINNFTASWNYGARVTLDIVIGVMLLVAIMNAG